MEVEYPVLHVEHEGVKFDDVGPNCLVKHCVVIPGKPDKSQGHPKQGVSQ
jgi:hypothetical protein